MVWFFYNTELFGLFFLIGFSVFVITQNYVSSHYWISEFSEKKIFVNLYRSLEFIDLCFKDNGKESKLYRGKTLKHVRKALAELNKMSSREYANSIFFNKQFASRLKRLSDNVQDRILSRIVKSKDLTRTTSVLRGLAKLFGEIQKPMSMSRLDSINENLETFEEMPFKERAVKPMFTKAIVSRPAQLIFSIFLGYFSITVIIWLFSQFLSIDFAEFMRSNLVVVISGGAVLSGIIASLFILKK